MGDDDARSQRAPLRALRDLGLLLFVAAALVAGLIHYSLARDDAQSTRPPATSPSASARPGPTSTASPTSSWTPDPSTGQTSDAASGPTIGATSEPAPSTATATTTVAQGVTCWDDSVAPRLSSCQAPDGVAGLRWVFPTLDRLGSTCHQAPHPAGSYDTVVGRECFTRFHGHPVTITFEEVASEPQAEEAIDRSYAGGKMFAVEGARGGRCTWFDDRDHPARATGYYQGFPYVVSLYSARRDTVKQAWSSLVRFRPPGQIRGTRS